MPKRIAPYVDALYPMVYPSHFSAPASTGSSDPDAYPGRTVARALLDFRRQLKGTGMTLIPWLQDFSLAHPYTHHRGDRPDRAARQAAHARLHALEPRGRVHEGRPGGLTDRRDVAVVLSGGGMSGIMMELGFLQRLRESELWERVGVFFGTSAGALAGCMAALDRLDELEGFLLALKPEEAFRAHTLWRLPLLGTHDYVLPRTIERWFGDLDELARRARRRPSGSSSCRHRRHAGAERARHRPALRARVLVPDVPAARRCAQAVLASAAISALVLPIQVGDRIGTDGGWVRNYPLGYAYDRPEVELIVGFRYVPRYPVLSAAGAAARRSAGCAATRSSRRRGR